MKFRMKPILTICLLVMLLVLVSGCAAKESPYSVNDGENYTVSVKYDANGGFFTTNTFVIVDSYNISDMETASSGNVEIPLLSPDNENRGVDAFTVANSGHFLAGWYAERTESTDSEGETVYSYSKRWNFDNDRLEVDPAGTYTSSEPVLTLYAVWVPMFEVEFYDLDSGEALGSKTFDPTSGKDIVIPGWNPETGKMDLNDFPQRDGYTFNGAYLDAEGTQPITVETLKHPGKVDEATGIATDSTIKIYVDWIEGNWFHIYNAKQFKDNASVNGHYIIHEDLDFSDEIWPTSMMYGNFTGTIEGNGHTFRNIEVVQTQNSKTNVGLFGMLAEGAALKDVTFENVTFTIKSGTRVKGTSFGLFAGTINSGAALENVSILSGQLQIDSGVFFGTDDYTIGLVCGTGDPSVVASADITCTAVGDHPEQLEISVSGNEVTVTKV